MTLIDRIRRVLWWSGLPARMVVIGLLLVYRRTFRGAASGRCRFHPTCSTYALEAVRRLGAVHGGGLAVWRVLRCNPLFRGGVDPVPASRWARAVTSDGVIHGVAENGA